MLPKYYLKQARMTSSPHIEEQSFFFFSLLLNLVLTLKSARDQLKHGHVNVAIVQRKFVLILIARKLHLTELNFKTVSLGRTPAPLPLQRL